MIACQTTAAVRVRRISKCNSKMGGISMIPPTPGVMRIVYPAYPTAPSVDLMSHPYGPEIPLEIFLEI